MFDWLAMGFELSGEWLVGNKKRVAFIIKGVGCIFWLIFGLTIQSWPLVITGGVFGAINIRNFLKWKRISNFTKK